MKIGAHREQRSLFPTNRRNAGRNRTCPVTSALIPAALFTDLVAISEDGAVRVAKHPSTPESTYACVSWVCWRKSEIPFEAIERIVHGNDCCHQRHASADRSKFRILSPRLALRMSRSSKRHSIEKKEYDLHGLKPPALVKRRNCSRREGTDQRQGEVVLPLTADTLAALKTDIENAAKPSGRCHRSLPALFVHQPHPRTGGRQLS